MLVVNYPKISILYDTFLNSIYLISVFLKEEHTFKCSHNTNYWWTIKFPLVFRAKVARNPSRIMAYMTLENDNTLTIKYLHMTCQMFLFHQIFHWRQYDQDLLVSECKMHAYPLTNLSLSLECVSTVASAQTLTSLLCCSFYWGLLPL